MDIRAELFLLQDEGYRDFQAKLTPSVPKEDFIGVRVPELRKLARRLHGTPEAAEFMASLPHRYYDENNLHGFLICLIRDYDRALAEVERFLPFVDNWATCDLMSPKVLGTRPDDLLSNIRRWVASDRTYTIRFGLEMLMTFYLDERFSAEVLDLAASVRSSEYYVNMMIAWFFATALAKQYDAALECLLQPRLDVWTHNKAIQKAIESRRITDEQKAYLRTLKRQPRR